MTIYDVTTNGDVPTTDDFTTAEARKVNVTERDVTIDGGVATTGDVTIGDVTTTGDIKTDGDVTIDDVTTTGDVTMDCDVTRRRSNDITFLTPITSVSCFVMLFSSYFHEILNYVRVC